MRTCCICGKSRRTRVAGEDILIYGCKHCGLGKCEANEEELASVEITTGNDPQKAFYQYGKPLKDAQGQALNGLQAVL